MRKTTLLNSEISYEISRIGHTQSLCVTDAGFPIPNGTKRIDTAIVKGVPGFLQVLEAVLSELCVEKAILAEEIKVKSPQMHAAILERLEGIPVEYISHEDFKRQSGGCTAIIRTGETVSFSNVLLIAGVTF